VLATARRIAQGLTLLAGGILALAWFSAGHPLVVPSATGVSAFAVALAVGRPTRYLLGQSKTDVRASLLGVCLFSSFAVAIAGLRRGVAFDENELLGWAGGVALFISVVVLWVDPTLRRTHTDVMGTLSLAAFFGFGAVNVANRDLDRGPATLYPAMVEQSQDGDTGEHRVRLPGWEPEAKAGVVSLPAELHESAKNGSSICVQLWPGALGVRWYELRECPAS